MMDDPHTVGVEKNHNPVAVAAEPTSNETQRSHAQEIIGTGGGVGILNHVPMVNGPIIVCLRHSSDESPGICTVKYTGHWQGTITSARFPVPIVHCPPECVNTFTGIHLHY